MTPADIEAIRRVVPGLTRWSPIRRYPRIVLSRISHGKAFAPPPVPRLERPVRVKRRAVVPGTGICSVCDIRKRVTEDGNVKLHKRNQERCAGSLLPPRPVKSKPPMMNWANIRRTVLARDRSCRKCGATNDLQAHHKHERVFGGPDTLENLITLCGTCHAEWTHLEPPAAVATFEQWLTVPRNDWLVGFWLGAWPEGVSAADFKRTIIGYLKGVGRYPHP